MIKFSSLWCSRGIGVGSTSAAKRSHNIDKATVVLHPSLGTTSLLLLLLLGINLEGRGREREREYFKNSQFFERPPYLWCLSPNFTSTSKRSMDLT